MRLVCGWAWVAAAALMAVTVGHAQAGRRALSQGGATIAGALASADHERGRERVFQTIYDNKVWEPWGCPSGWSHPNEVKGAMYILELVVHKYGLGSMVDLPCGDMCYMPLVLQQIWQSRPGFTYHGVDIVPTLVAEHRARFATEVATGRMSFDQVDAVRAPSLPPAELVYSRWMMNHLCERDVVEVLRRVHESGARYALLTHTALEGDKHATHPMSCEYADLHKKVVDVGANAVQTTLYDLTKPPFSLPEPLHVYSEMHKSGHELFTLGLFEVPFSTWGEGQAEP